MAQAARRLALPLLRRGTLACAAITTAALIAPSLAEAKIVPDPSDVRGPLDLKQVKVSQELKLLQLRFRTFEPLPRLNVLDRRPSHLGARKERYLCLLYDSHRSGRRLICPGGRLNNRRIKVGVSHVSKSGGIRPAHSASAMAKRGKRSLRLELPLEEIGVAPGKLRFAALSGYYGGGCRKPARPRSKATSCIDHAPKRGSRRLRINPVGVVGCTPPRDLAVTNGPRSRKRVALTFDDGPGDYTNEVLRVLDRYDVEGTFFQIGEQVPDNGGILRKILAQGSELANHSMHHSMGPGKADLRQTNATIERATGFKPCLFRPPGGYLPGSTAAAARDLGMISVLWDVDTEDWKQPGSGTVASRGRAGTKGSIVLMHDGGGNRSQTVEALPQIIKSYRSRGYKMVTVTKLIGGRVKLAEVRGR